MSKGYEPPYQPKWTRKHTAITLLAAILIVLYISAVKYNDFIQHSFKITTQSETELKRALTIKALQLLHVGAGGMVCSDNIREYNITGYRLMSYEEILDAADVQGDLEYVGVDSVEVESSDATIWVYHSWVAPRNSTLVFLSGDGTKYRFHNYLGDFWTWSIEVSYIS
jgi:hypothetical protein